VSQSDDNFTATCKVDEIQEKNEPFVGENNEEFNEPPASKRKSSRLQRKSRKRVNFNDEEEFNE
tara:strand:+ start:289 stop:480 length:192 start_codon:yes stop_codon:yes gene_type:complete